MIFFNLSGFIGILISVLLAWLPMQYLETKFSTGVALYGFVLIVLFISSIVGFSLDRTESDRFFHSYKESISQFYNQVLRGNRTDIPAFNPKRRLLVFIWPLAFGPLVPLSLISMFWIFELINRNKYATNKQYALYWATSFLFVLISLIYGYFTKSLRQLNKKH